MEAPETTRYLNVDLDLRSPASLQLLVEALQPAAFLLHDEPGLVTLELGEEKQDLEATILRFCELVEALPTEARLLWNGCDRRTMNVGIQAGATPRYAVFSLSRRVLDSLARVGADVEFTVYVATARPPA